MSLIIIIVSIFSGHSILLKSTAKFPILKGLAPFSNDLLTDEMVPRALKNSFAPSALSRLKSDPAACSTNSIKNSLSKPQGVLELKFASALISPIPIPPQFHRYLTLSLSVFRDGRKKIQSEWPAVCVCSVLIALVRRRTQTKDKGALIKQKELENRTQTNWPTRIIFIAVRGLFWERSPRENRRHPTARFYRDKEDSALTDWPATLVMLFPHALVNLKSKFTHGGEMLSPLAPLLAPSFLGAVRK
jgi:hypothetical protein